jgi:hypothetical protein
MEPEEFLRIPPTPPPDAARPNSPVARILDYYDLAASSVKLATFDYLARSNGSAPPRTCA